MVPPGHGVGEPDEDEDLFAEDDDGEADAATALSAAAGGRKEELVHPDPDSLPHRLCSMGLCEVFSPPRVGK